MKEVSGKKLVSVLKKHGWDLIRSKGSHFTLEKPGREGRVTVPVHGNKPLAPSLLARLMKDTDLKQKDL